SPPNGRRGGDADITHVCLYRPAHPGDDPGHGGRRTVRLLAAAFEPWRPGGHHRRRHRDIGRHCPDPSEARAEPLYVQFVTWVWGLLHGDLGISTDLLPVQGFVTIGGGIWPFLSHIIMPTLALGMVFAALIARMTRASMLDVLAQDYIRTAQAKGLANDKVLIGHALKNAAVPIVTIVGIGVAALISGVVVTETVFAIPGLGRLTVAAVLRRA